MDCITKSEMWQICWFHQHLKYSAKERFPEKETILSKKQNRKFWYDTSIHFRKFAIFCVVTVISRFIKFYHNYLTTLNFGANTQICKINSRIFLVTFGWNNQPYLLLSFLKVVNDNVDYEHIIVSLLNEF